MDLIITKLRIPVEKDGINEYLKAASKKLNVAEKDLKFIKMLGKSLDVSDKEQLYFEISIAVKAPKSVYDIENVAPYIEKLKTSGKIKKIKDRPIIVGFGPAGIFAALEFIDRGIKPLIFERGKKIEDRAIDVHKFIKEQNLNTESNIQFGEGGAGSFSDGKLFSRMRNSEYITKVLNTFIKFGAPKEISYVNKPHLGTDILCEIIRDMRKYILERGGDIYYESKMTDMIISGGKISGIVINGRKKYRSSAIFLAVGHSARDTFEMINRKEISLEQRTISIGVRIEHPSADINLMRYGKKYQNFPGLGAATYSFNTHDKKVGRGISTFCMCPGGEVINASSEKGMMVINGMSYSSRSSSFSNSALIVPCRAEDYKSSHPLAGFEFQKAIEKKAFKAGRGSWKIPAQNLTDFMSGKISGNLIENSCKMGTVSANLAKILPPFISETLLAAFNKWKENYPLFISDQALLMAPETRTTCPMKINRDEKFESINIKNLFPIGEGSGYTGGITSSAADGIKAVKASIDKK